jgi:hypothetical protein
MFRAQELFVPSRLPTITFQVSIIDGQYSLTVISYDIQKAGLGKEASNSTSESDFALTKQAVKGYKTLYLDSAGVAEQTRTSDDFGRCDNLLTGIKISGHICPSSPDTLLVYGHNSAIFLVRSLK